MTATHQPDIYDDLLTVPEVAEWLRVEPRFVYRLVSSEQLDRCNVGRYIRIPSQSVKDYLKANTAEPVTPAARQLSPWPSPSSLSPGGARWRTIRAVVGGSARSASFHRAVTRLGIPVLMG